MPLKNLTDSRVIEGTYPLFNSNPFVDGGSGEEDIFDGGIKSSDGDNADDGGDGYGQSRPTYSESRERRERHQHQQQEQRTGTGRNRASPSCFGGLFDPSLELGVYLYRMGPLNSYSTASSGGGGDGGGLCDPNSSGMLCASDRKNAGDGTVNSSATSGRSGFHNKSRGAGGNSDSPDPPTAAAAPVLWKPPSLVERGKVGLRGQGSTSSVSLFGRTKMERGSITSDSNS